MSKIFDAYKKQARLSSDVTRVVASAGTIKLFPLPGDSQRAEFSKLANRLLGMRTEGRGVSIGFASSASGEGASFVSYHTALVLAQDYDQKVAWIDGNFLSPQKSLNATNSTSFCTLIREPGALGDLIPSGNPQLIPGGTDLVGARGHFAGENYRQLMDKLKDAYDFVIIDMPPVLNSNDTALMAREVEGLLLVVEQKYLKWEVINHGIESLREKDVKVLGSVINRRKFDLPKVLYDRL
jgi:Mrp family chromosome partitioning ATPase